MSPEIEIIALPLSSGLNFVYNMHIVQKHIIQYIIHLCENKKLHLIKLAHMIQQYREQHKGREKGSMIVSIYK